MPKTPIWLDESDMWNQSVVTHVLTCPESKQRLLAQPFQTHRYQLLYHIHVPHIFSHIRQAHISMSLDVYLTSSQYDWYTASNDVLLFCAYNCMLCSHWVERLLISNKRTPNPQVTWKCYKFAVFLILKCQHRWPCIYISTSKHAAATKQNQYCESDFQSHKSHHPQPTTSHFHHKSASVYKPTQIFFKSLA